MTRKDYILIADAFGGILSRAETDGERCGINMAVGAVACALLKDNARFDMNRFFSWVDGIKK